MMELEVHMELEQLRLLVVAEEGRTVDDKERCQGELTSAWEEAERR